MWDAALETQLCYEVKTFLLAGHETSASMLTWSVYELSRNPACLAKVREEAARVYGKAAVGATPPPRRDVDNMVYTLSVLKEALRKYSVVPTVTRKLAVDDELLGHPIPAGTMIALNLQVPLASVVILKLLFMWGFQTHGTFVFAFFPMPPPPGCSKILWEIHGGRHKTLGISGILGGLLIFYLIFF